MNLTIKLNLLAAATLMGLCLPAKHLPGIQPVYAPQGNPAWVPHTKGPAMAEMEARDPGRVMASLVGKDGIINFHPELLPGILQTTGSPDPLLKISPQRIPGGSNLCGFIGYNKLDADVGMYRIPLAVNHRLTMLKNLTGMLSTFGAGASDGRYYVMSYFGTTTLNGQDQCLTAIYDTEDWSLLAEQGDYGEYGRNCCALTYDPVTMRYYGCFMNKDQSGWSLGYMQSDKNTPRNTINKIVTLSALETSLNGIACDSEGVLWGIRNDNGELVHINKKTGAMDKIASTGFVPGYGGSLTWEPTEERLYWAVTYRDNTSPSGISSAILNVNPESGELTQLYKYTDAAQTFGLYTEYTPMAEAPGQFTGLFADFNEGSLSGIISFDAPAGLADGTPADGTLQYSIKAIKESGFVAYSADSQCTYGQKGVTVPVTLASSGRYTFIVQGYNALGAGHPLSIKTYVGADAPRPVQNITLEYNDGLLTVAWEPVEGTVNGGYFDPSRVSYDISAVRCDADGKLSDLGHITTCEPSATWHVPDGNDLYGYTAVVTTVYGAQKSEPASSPYIWTGALQIPFIQSMTAKTDGWIPYAQNSGGKWYKDSSSKGSGWAIPFNWPSKNNAWLFSPAIYMEAGHYYKFTFKAWSSVVDHSIQVWMGTSADVNSMRWLKKSLTVEEGGSKSNYQTVTVGFECPETGIYHMGLLNNTSSNTYTNLPNMWINDVECVQAADDAPAAPLLSADYDPAGTLSAEIRMTAPLKTYTGDDLHEIDRFVLSIDGTPVQEYTGVQPGQSLSYHYEPPKKGNHVFTAVAYCGQTEGIPAEQNVFIGMSTPVDPAWVDVRESTQTPGLVDITWDPVTKGTNGQEIDPEVISYNLINVLSNRYVGQGVRENSYQYAACEPDKQEAICISVNAQTDAGQSSTYGTVSKQSIMHVGTPYGLPLRETFADGMAHYSWSFVNQSSAYDNVSVVKAATELGIGDANGDGYLLKAFVPYLNSQASLYSGRVEIPADASHPILSLAVCRPVITGADQNNNSLSISILGDKQQGAIPSIVYGNLEYGWQYLYFDLSQFKGQTVNLLLTFATQSLTVHYVDDIQLFDAKDYDLSVNNVILPTDVVCGTPMQGQVSVTNTGTQILGTGKALLHMYRNDEPEPVFSTPVPKLKSFQTAMIPVTDPLNGSYDEDLTYSVKIEYDADQNTGNNQGQAVVAVSTPFMPAPHSLTAFRNDGGFASLSWDKPDLTPICPMAEVNFDDSTAPSVTDLGGFSSYDMDGNPLDPSLGVTGIAGFFSFYHPSLARSGSWMVVSACNEGGAPKEDWLISPKLSGHQQTISFYARTNWSAFESFTVLTSTGGNAPADFTEEVKNVRTNTNDWQRVEVQLPEGTDFFAIKCKADDTSGLVYLMLDDFTFEQGDIYEGLEVKGYNTYRNHLKVSASHPHEEWEDTESTPGPQFYKVTADYGEMGESAPSNEVFIFTRGSGIDPASGCQGKICSIPGGILVQGASGASLSVTDDKGFVYFMRNPATEEEMIPLDSGIYILSIDGKSIKLTVK